MNINLKFDVSETKRTVGKREVSMHVEAVSAMKGLI